MSEKFVEKKVEIKGGRWLEMQKSALDYLESKKNRIKQEDILFYSFRRFINEEIGKTFREFSKDTKRIYFAPIVTDEIKSLDNASANLKFYYEDELEKYNWNQKIDVPFNNNLENNPLINAFITKFLQEYDFRIETSQPITENMFVRISKINQASQKEYLNFETSDQRFRPLTEQLLGIGLGGKKEILQNGELNEVTVEKLWEYKKMPITDQNAKLLKMPEIHDVESAKKYITDTVTEQMFLNEIISYKMQVVDELIRKLPKLQISEEFIEAEAKEKEAKFMRDLSHNIKNPDFFKEAFYNQKSEIKKIARAQAERDIQLSFYDSLLAKGLGIKIKDDEIIKEEKTIYSFIPPSQRNDANIDISKIISVLTARKIGLYFLERNHPKVFEKYTKNKNTL